MSMFNDIGWTKKGNRETCLHKAKEVAAFATQSKPGHLCFLELVSEKTVARKARQTQGQRDSIAVQMVDVFKCHTFQAMFPATEPLSLGQLRNGGRHYHF